jgi:hypothetical protein
LWPDEAVLRMATGFYGRGNGLVVLTTRRLMFVLEGLVSHQTEDFPLDKLSSVQWGSGLTMGTNTVYASGTEAEIKNVGKDDGKALVDQVRGMLSGASLAGASTNEAPSIDPKSALPPPPAATTSSDPLEQMRILNQMHDAGFLTEEEFSAKKAEILARM